jgi:hypothetical protein
MEATTDRRCLECGRVSTWFSRGLCQKCYKDHSIRDRYPCRQNPGYGGVSPSQREALNFLASLPPNVVPGTALARHKGICRQSAEGIIDRLVRKGLWTPQNKMAPAVSLLLEVDRFLSGATFSFNDRPAVASLRARIAAVAG